MQASFVNELLDMLSEMRHQLAHQQRQIDSLKAETRGDLQQVWFALRQQAVAGAGARAVGALGRSKLGTRSPTGVASPDHGGSPTPARDTSPPARAPPPKSPLGKKSDEAAAADGGKPASPKKDRSKPASPTKKAAELTTK